MKKLLYIIPVSLIALLVYAATDVKNGALATGLTVYWKLDETSGARYDAHGATSTDLTDGGSVGYSASCKQSNCADFNDTNNLYVADTADLRPDTDQNYSISLWVYMDTTAGLDGIFSKEGGGGGYTLYRNGTDLGYNHQGIGGTAENAVTTNTWYHVCITYNGATDSLKQYTSSSAFDTTPQTATVGYTSSGSATFTMGNYTTVDYDFDGRIDEFAFWKARELTSGECEELFNAGTGIPYDAGGGGGSTLVDGPKLIWLQ